MRNFHLVAQGIIVMPFMQNLMRHPELWNEDDCRTTFEGTPHADADDILLRFGAPNGDDLEAADRRAMQTVGAKDMCLNLMRMVNGSRLGRVIVTRLAPGARILPHADVLGAYSSYYSRYHLVLQGLPGSIFRCGDEEVNMQTGQFWWFDAHQEHEVLNNSADDRVHLLVDVKID